MSDNGNGHADGFGALLDVSVGIKAELGKLREDTKRAAKRDLTPVDYLANGAGVFPNTGNLVLDLGGPPQGHEWLGRRAVVASSPASTTVAGAAWWYKGPVAVASAQDPSTLVDMASSIPLVGWYSTRQFPVVFPEHVVVVLIGGTAGTYYAATLQVEDYAVTPALERAGFEYVE